MIKRTISIQGKYFWIAIVIVGTIGIWLPFIFEASMGKEVSINTLPIALTTYYVAIYFAGCVDSMLKLFDDFEGEPKSILLNIVFLLLLSIALVIATVWLSINDSFILSLGFALIGTIIALRLWWINNKENPTFGEVIRGGSRKIKESFPNS